MTFTDIIKSYKKFDYYYSISGSFGCFILFVFSLFDDSIAQRPVVLFFSLVFGLSNLLSESLAEWTVRFLIHFSAWRSRDVANQTSENGKGFWMNIFLPAQVARQAIDDMDDLYNDFWTPKYGHKRAVVIYYHQSILLVCRFWWSEFEASIFRFVVMLIAKNLH